MRIERTSFVEGGGRLVLFFRLTRLLAHLVSQVVDFAAAALAVVVDVDGDGAFFDVFALVFVALVVFAAAYVHLAFYAGWTLSEWAREKDRRGGTLGRGDNADEGSAMHFGTRVTGASDQSSFARCERSWTVEAG